MKTIKVTNTKSKGKPGETGSAQCGRCQGYLIQGWDTELDRTVQRCLLCGNRVDLIPAKQSDSDVSF